MEKTGVLWRILCLAAAAILPMYGGSLLAAGFSQTEDASGEKYALSRVASEPSVGQSDLQLPQMPGWPKTMGVHAIYAPSGCALADVDGDGYLDIIGGSTDGSFHVWDYQGNHLSGWPKTGLGLIQTEPAVGDIDGDGYPEIVVPDRTGNLYVWTYDGASFPGWPQSVGETGGFKAAVLFDLDGDDTLEIILGQRLWPDGRVNVFTKDGTAFPGWPQPLDYMCVATPSVADVDGDGAYEICAVSYYSIYVWDQNGNLEPGWPVLNYYGGASYAQPTLCDLDGDGDLEILVVYYTGGQDYVSVFHHDGTVFTGWPQTYPGPQGYVCPVTGDIDGDGDLEIFSGGHVMGGFDFSSRHHNGSQVSGWPVMVGMAECSPIIFDLDGDGDREIVVGANYTGPGYVYAFHGNGSSVAGWPFTMSGAAGVNSPAVGDVDLDGDLEIALVNGDGTVNLWTSEGVPYRAYYTDWGSYFHDLWNTGWFHPLAPEGLSASLAPSGVELIWNQNPEPDVAGYNLYRSDSSGGPYDKISQILFPDTAYTDTTVDMGNTYYYVATCVIKAQAESRLGDEVSITTGVEEGGSYQLPVAGEQSLQVYPNPFGASGAVISFNLDGSAGDISLNVYDITGQLVRNFAASRLSAGSGRFFWDGSNGEGEELPAGLYYLKLVSVNFDMTVKVILLR